VQRFARFPAVTGRTNAITGIESFGILKAGRGAGEESG
jgi:hypothetical protein